MLPFVEREALRDSSPSACEGDYSIYSIKRRPRFNAADGNQTTNKRRISSEECGVYSRIIGKNSVQLRNLHHPDIYDSMSAK